MGDWGGVPGLQDQLLLAETLGLAMARRAADILERHRYVQTPAAPGDGVPAASRFAADDAKFVADDAVFSAVLDAAIDCLGPSGPSGAFGPSDAGSDEDRWCDALVHLLLLARLPPDAIWGSSGS